jgi:hypothetical protein
MPTLQNNINETISRLQALRDLADKEPEFNNWCPCEGSAINPKLVQLFGPKPSEATKESAMKIAQAFGGKWISEKDGCWHGEIPIAGDKFPFGYKVILHDVEPSSCGSAIIL